MSLVRMKLSEVKLTEQDIKELEELAKKPDSEIDYSDIPQINPEDWKSAVRGKFYRPRKQSISLRLDADVLAWFKQQGPGYQTRINNILREVMIAQINRQTKSLPTR